MPGQHNRTTTERGLGYRHRKQVEYLLSIHIEGTICWWCAEPMFKAQGLQGDHSVPRCIAGPNQLADRLLHGWCNAQRGDGSRDAERPALTGKPLPRQTKHQAPDLGTLTMRWP
jgi:hypothetical protein